MSVLDDPAGLDAVADGLRAGHSLPASWYADPELLAREQELIFRRSWHYAGRADQVAEPGGFLRVDAGPVPLVIVRGRDGELRALVNVCRHRGHPVLDGEGTLLDAAVPVPRVDVRPRRRAAQGPARRPRAGPRPRRARPPPRERRDLGAVPVRASRPRRAGVRRDARRAARRARGLRRRPRAARVPPPRAVDARGELEGRGRELPRVLPLPGRPPGTRQGDRRRRRRLRARGVPRFSVQRGAPRGRRRRSGCTRAR